MRVRQLSLERFGHFTDKVYDFGPASKAADFHIIYGPNEAGKTTTMEALLRLFYGFPNKEPYGFRHDRKSLSISAVLDIDGTSRVLTRIAPKSALLDEHGNSLPDSALAAHLGGLSLDDYRSLLCLDDKTIETGGEEIANAKGDIGRLLFSAAAGVSDLTGILDHLRAKADGIYRKRASSTLMAQLKKDLAEVDRAIRDSDVSASTWRKLKQAKQAAEQAEAAARDLCNDLRLRMANVSAQRRALPLLVRHNALQDRLAGFADYPERLDIDPETLVALLSQQRHAQSELTRLHDETAQTDAALSEIVLHKDAQALGEAIEALDILHGRYLTAENDLPNRRKELQEAEAAMVRAASDLGVTEGADLRALVLSPAQIAAMDQAGADLREARNACKIAAKEAADQQQRHDMAASDLRKLQADAPAHLGLMQALDHYDIDRLAPDHAMAVQALGDALAQRDAALDALSLGGVVFDHLPDCALTPPQAGDLAQTHDVLAQQLAQAQTQAAQHQEQAEVLAAQIAQMATQDGLVGDARAQAIRDQRDALWQTHLEALTSDTATRFAQAMAQVDASAEARLSNASALGQLRQAEQEQAKARARAARATLQAEQLQSTLSATAAKAAQCAAVSGLPDLSPAAFRDWVQRHATAAQAQRQFDRMTERHIATLDKAARFLAEVTPLIRRDSPGFDGALAAARQLAASERAHLDRSTIAQKAFEAAQAELSRRQALHEAAQQAEQGATQTWRALVRETLGTAVDAEVALASGPALSALRSHDDASRTLMHRIEGMQADQARFAAQVTALATAYDVPKSAAPPDTFAALRAFAETARLSQSQHTQLSQKRQDLQAAADQAKRALSDIAAQVRDLGQLFPAHVPCADIDQLRRATMTAQEVIADRRHLSDLRLQILSELALPDMTAVTDALAADSPTGLEAKANSLQTDLDRAEDQLTAATADRAGAARDLAAVTGDASVADLVEHKATLELQIEEAVLAYLQLSLGLRQAEEAIRRYRDAHRSDMMQATERAFADLTNGAYARLQTQSDGSAERLLVIDAAGTAKQAEDLSKGTRFQLYLALRAAAYDQLTGQGVCLPFLCDDIFETFDEDRTRAAVGLMQRIGRSGQAIYLTHHRHVVDIAKAVCGGDVTVHDIV